MLYDSSDDSTGVGNMPKPIPHNMTKSPTQDLFTPLIQDDYVASALHCGIHAMYPPSLFLYSYAAVVKSHDENVLGTRTLEIVHCHSELVPLHHGGDCYPSVLV